MSNARVRLPPELEKIHLFQMEDCIKQANLGEQDRNMARMYLIDKIAATDRRFYRKIG